MICSSSYIARWSSLVRQPLLRLMLHFIWTQTSQLQEQKKTKQTLQPRLECRLKSDQLGQLEVITNQRLLALSAVLAAVFQSHSSR